MRKCARHLSNRLTEHGRQRGEFHGGSAFGDARTLVVAFLHSSWLRWGSAVGLGNLWRFPFQTGANGGSAFVLIYIACVALIAFPVLMAEFTIGRRAQKSAVSLDA